jgi:hypothetical protein
MKEKEYFHYSLFKVTWCCLDVRAQPIVPSGQVRLLYLCEMSHPCSEVQMAVSMVSRTRKGPSQAGSSLFSFQVLIST